MPSIPVDITQNEVGGGDNSQLLPLTNLVIDQTAMASGIPSFCIGATIAGGTLDNLDLGNGTFTYNCPDDEFGTIAIPLMVSYMNGVCPCTGPLWVCVSNPCDAPSGLSITCPTDFSDPTSLQFDFATNDPGAPALTISTGNYLIQADTGQNIIFGALGTPDNDSVTGDLSAHTGTAVTVTYDVTNSCGETSSIQETCTIPCAPPTATITCPSTITDVTAVPIGWDFTASGNWTMNFGLLLFSAGPATFPISLPSTPVGTQNFDFSSVPPGTVVTIDLVGRDTCSPFNTNSDQCQITIPNLSDACTTNVGCPGLTEATAPSCFTCSDVPSQVSNPDTWRADNILDSTGTSLSDGDGVEPDHYWSGSNDSTNRLVYTGSETLSFGVVFDETQCSSFSNQIYVSDNIGTQTFASQQPILNWWQPWRLGIQGAFNTTNGNAGNASSLFQGGNGVVQTGDNQLLKISGVVNSCSGQVGPGPFSVDSNGGTNSNSTLVVSLTQGVCYSAILSVTPCSNRICYEVSWSGATTNVAYRNPQTNSTVTVSGSSGFIRQTITDSTYLVEDSDGGNISGSFAYFGSFELFRDQASSERLVLSADSPHDISALIALQSAAC